MAIRDGDVRGASSPLTEEDAGDLEEEGECRLGDECLGDAGDLEKEVEFRLGDERLGDAGDLENEESSVWATNVWPCGPNCARPAWLVSKYVSYLSDQSVK